MALEKDEQHLLRRVSSEEWVLLTPEDHEEFAAAISLADSGLLRTMKTAKRECCLFVLTGSGIKAARQLPYEPASYEWRTQ